MENVDTFGSKMRQLRKSRGMSARELSDRTNIHYNTISGFVGGSRKPNPDQIKAVAEVLEWDLQDAMHSAGLHFKGARNCSVEELEAVMEALTAPYLELDPEARKKLSEHLVEIAWSYAKLMDKNRTLQAIMYASRLLPSQTFYRQAA